MGDDITINFNAKFRYLPDLPISGDKVNFSGLGIDINGIVKNVEIIGNDYNCIIEPIYEGGFYHKSYGEYLEEQNSKE